MHPIRRYFIRPVLKTLLVFISCTLLYLAYAFVVTLVPVNSAYEAPVSGTTIYIRSNGFHTDLILPLHHTDSSLDWMHIIRHDSLREKFQSREWIALGWGDEGFYFDSYNGKFPSAGTTVKAIFWPTHALMHVEFLQQRPKVGEQMIQLHLRDDEYRKLCETIQSSFSLDTNGHFIVRKEPGYYFNDVFFDAEESYHLFNTCNHWTNDVLKRAGLKASLAAPFDRSVLWRFRKTE
ncbi:MAG: TIGR02117 family protein [Bacteroidia bacterium]